MRMLQVDADLCSVTIIYSVHICLIAAKVTVCTMISTGKGKGLHSLECFLAVAVYNTGLECCCRLVTYRYTLQLNITSNRMWQLAVNNHPKITYIHQVPTLHVAAALHHISAWGHSVPRLRQTWKESWRSQNWKKVTLGNEHPERAFLHQGESGLYPKSECGWLLKFNGDFLIHRSN